MQPSPNPIFEKTYFDYLEKLKAVSPAAVAEVLGAVVEDDELLVDLYGRRYRVSPAGIVGPHGRRPGFETCVILCKYILLCPESPQLQTEWASFKNFRDTAPLVGYFRKDVEGALADRYSGRLTALKQAARALGANPSPLSAGYDLAMELDALPRIPVTLLFNDVDDEFPADCRLLFQRRTEKHLDGECIAMLGWRLLPALKGAGDSST